VVVEWWVRLAIFISFDQRRRGGGDAKAKTASIGWNGKLRRPRGNGILLELEYSGIMKTSLDLGSALASRGRLASSIVKEVLAAKIVSC
jgi:hypothetical protein